MATSTASAISNLAWGLLSTLQGNAKETQSIFFSPLSIVVAFGMLSGAADDETKQKLLENLGVEGDKELQSITSLITSGGSSKSSSITVANAIFADQSISLFSAYKTFLEGFNAEFIQYPNLAEEVDAINSWISNSTENLIQNMLSKELLKQAHTVIINALAFKGSWETEFNEKQTRSVPFHVSTTEQRSVRMMHLHKTKIWSRTTSSYDAVRLPYGTPRTSPNQTSMVAYLPKAGIPIEKVIEAIKKEGAKPLDGVFSQVKYDQFGFPKFETVGEYSLKETLGGLGFPLSGNFPNMGTGGDCLVQEIVHKAFVKVDEKGTTAAAATAVIMTRSRPMNPKILIFDRPFAFAIMSNDSGVNLFSGIYYGD